MSGPARRLHDYTYAQYVALEEESSIRHEYLDGEIYAMAGGSPDHAALAAAIIGLLGPQLFPCLHVGPEDPDSIHRPLDLPGRRGRLRPDPTRDR